MPATAGRVRMPANNRVHSSAALQTHGIWQSAIGYDPYAPNKDDSKSSSHQNDPSTNKTASEPEGENAYASFQGLLALARITGSNADEARGACKRCGRVGHLSFQCRNFLSIKDDIDEKDKDPEAIQAAVLSGLEKIKGNGKIARKEESEEGEEGESDTSDSEADSEIERIIAERYGKKRISRGRSSQKEKDDGSESDDGERKKRGRSKKRRNKKRYSDDSEDDDESRRKKRRKEKRRKSNESSNDEDEDRRRHNKRKSRKEKRRRRSHRYSDDSDSDTSEDYGRRHRRRSRKAASPSESDVSSSDDSRIGRGTKRSEKEKRSKKRHPEEDE